MRRTPPDRRSAPALPGVPATDAASIDALYGLEPVFEPGAKETAEGSDRGGRSFQTVHCPYCGEPFETLVDLSAGSAQYIEDCQICCQPIELDVQVDHAGGLTRLSAARGD
ncbi:MAG TPA: CPXCG motif-containing cysteine-rich protein [Steroidobacteraceae bacterium]|nr:CPXCG motif-containing cysteine-rich protein [Steroidobacteraceae bacterium]